jgi:methylated-DNA-[protein]-cysteine S-methyltransferase
MLKNKPYEFIMVESPVGKLYLVAKLNRLIAIVFASEWPTFAKKHPNLISEKTPTLRKVETQLKEYFKGKRKSFQIQMEIMGTQFQKQAWKQLLEIPFGKTISYQEQCLGMRRPKAVRAVGSANGKNPFPILIPCHRVIAKSGDLAGYAGGLHIKAYLLKHEQMSQVSK